MATFFGQNGDDPMDGTAFGDRMYGHAGNDVIRGFGGDDKIIGEAGKDRLIGMGGDDTLIGDGTTKKAFADVFVFGRNSGKDIITDFQVGKDMLEITKGVNGIRKASDVLDHATQKGKNVIIDLGDGNKITLKNVDLDDLKKDPSDHFTIAGGAGSA